MTHKCLGCDYHSACAANVIRHNQETGHMGWDIVDERTIGVNHCPRCGYGLEENRVLDHHTGLYYRVLDCRNCGESFTTL